MSHPDLAVSQELDTLLSCLADAGEEAGTDIYPFNKQGGEGGGVQTINGNYKTKRVQVDGDVR